MRGFTFCYKICIFIVAVSVSSTLLSQHQTTAMKYPDTTIWLHPQVPVHFSYIPAGSYLMGSPESEPNRGADEGPVHEVTISKGFYMGQFEVTQMQWTLIMEDNPAVFNGFAESSIHPVESVTWNECQLFISKLNKRGIGKFRLPTEAEWEYACRAGTNTPYYWGKKMKINGSSEYAWANSRSFARTHAVGQKLPNGWGLYDMSGNVWEWCSDWFGPYTKHAQVNPDGPAEGKMKVFRGGSWYDFFESHRSANRHKHAPDERYTAIGFRLVMEVQNNE